MHAYLNAKGENECEQATCVRYEQEEPGECGDGQGTAGHALQAGTSQGISACDAGGSAEESPYPHPRPKLR